MRCPHSERHASRVQRGPVPAIRSSQRGASAFDAPTIGFYPLQHLLQVIDLNAKAGTGMRGVEVAARCRLKRPAPHRRMEALEDLRVRGLDLPPHDLRHGRRMPPQEPSPLERSPQPGSNPAKNLTHDNNGGSGRVHGDAGGQPAALHPRSHREHLSRQRDPSPQRDQDPQLKRLLSHIRLILGEYYGAPVQRGLVRRPATMKS